MEPDSWKKFISIFSHFFVRFHNPKTSVEKSSHKEIYLVKTRYCIPSIIPFNASCVNSPFSSEDESFLGKSTDNPSIGKKFLYDT